MQVTRRLTETKRERRLYSIRCLAKCLVFRSQNRSLDENAIRSPCYTERRQYRSRMRYLHKESRRNDFVYLHVYILRSRFFGQLYSDVVMCKWRCRLTDEERIDFHTPLQTIQSSCASRASLSSCSFLSQYLKLKWTIKLYFSFKITLGS